MGLGIMTLCTDAFGTAMKALMCICSVGESEN